MRPGWLLLSAAVACLPGPAGAATTATFKVSASVVPGCLVVGGVSNYGALDFGSWPALSTAAVSAQMPANGVRLQCTPGVVLNMKLDGGANASTGRNLKRSTGSALVPYQLYRDAGFSQALGIGQSVPVSYTDANNISLPIYGRAQPPGNVPAGTYSDVVQVELSW